MKKVSLLDWVWVIIGVSLSSSPLIAPPIQAFGSMMIFGTFLSIMNRD